MKTIQFFGVLKVVTVLAVSAIMFVSCSSLRVATDYDKEVNFGAYKTFGFNDKTNELPVNDLVRKRILNAVVSELTSKGLTQSEQPDLVIDVLVRTSERESVTARTEPMSPYFGRRWRVGPGWSATTTYDVSSYTEGTLIIGMGDTKKQELVWEGRGTAVVSGKTPEETRINKAVQKILASFPPTPKP